MIFEQCLSSSLIKETVFIDMAILAVWSALGVPQFN